MVTGSPVKGVAMDMHAESRQSVATFPATNVAVMRVLPIVGHRLFKFSYYLKICSHEDTAYSRLKSAKPNCLPD
jgi:hypothetical protein